MTPIRCPRVGCQGFIRDGECDICGDIAGATTLVRRLPAADDETTAVVPRDHRDALPTDGVDPAPGEPTQPVADVTESSLADVTESSLADVTESSLADVTERSLANMTQRSFANITDRYYRPRRDISGHGIDDDLEGVDAVEPRDPEEVLMVDPQVRESRRFCTSCGRPVGRGPGGKPGPPVGACSRCGTPYSFLPPLTVGDLVGNQYEVLGSLAHGGHGWVYLAHDRRVDDRLVVLKGLIDSADDSARAASIAERRFLAQLNDPRIVKIHNFVEDRHEDGTSSEYIVMEYVDGRTLRQLLEERVSAGGEVSNLYGTTGYQAPEVSRQGPSVQSDLYTVGRTLAVLALGIAPVHNGEPAPLPRRHPVLDRNESLHRLLLRATSPRPEDRFVSAAEMRDQLDRVKLEVDARTQAGTPVPKLSLVFDASRQTYAPDLLLDDRHVGRPDPAVVADRLPLPVVDHTDPAAALLANTSTEAPPDEIDELTEILGSPTPELRFARVRAFLAVREPQCAQDELDDVQPRDARDWQPTWHQGLIELANGYPDSAFAHFDRCFSLLPGETAVKLALGAAAECAGRDEDAERYYRMVNTVDSGQADAAFGLARVRLRSGERDGAVDALDSVPESSSLHQAARLAAIRARLTGVEGTDEVGLRQAAVRTERLSVDEATRARVRIDLYSAAVGLVGNGRSGSGPPLLGTRWTERDLRSALESELRELARMTTDPNDRVALVDRANREHPRTWL